MPVITYSVSWSANNPPKVTSQIRLQA